MKNNKTASKGLFLWLSVFSLISLMAVVTALWYFISPRLHEFHYTLPLVFLSGLRIFFLILVIGTILVLFTSVFEKNFLIAKFAVKLFIQIVYPISLLFGKIFRIPKSRIGESFIKVNDSLIRALKPKYKPSEVLILLPHCLQNTSCPIRITVEPKNCKRCGNCDIGAILEVAEEYNVDVAVATGGTLARRIVLEKRPKLIIAVACYRDLVSGIQDAFPIKTFGILNIRPQGPCINTKVEVEKIRNSLKQIVIKNK
ncbi:MAG: DUF116 domain-containing protein [Candidatus Cloacimonetes bacterium]|nr:DUF116 domain-containing protein [Candidatus Cloacimonadota bacterium]MBL7086864.1 DUF116 domain-containing protein [Candidatus Cloacimonadota bacterium]